MKEHPEELLAAYVDGELSERQRSSVEDHLAACERCSDEVELSRGAASALRALPEIPSPLGLATPAIQQARPARPFVERLQWALGAGAAAALIAIGVVVVTQDSARDSAAPGFEAPADAEGAGAEGGGDGAAPLASSLYVVTDEDYTPGELQEIVLTDGEDDRAVSAESVLDESAVAEAESCVQRAGLQAEEGAELIRVELAKYEGRAAYIVLFSTGDTTNVWAVDTGTCQILYVASAQS